MGIEHVDITPIEGLIQELWDRGGTDLHLTVGVAPMMRINGDLVPAEGHVPLQEDEAEKIIELLLPSDLYTTFQHRHQVDFSFPWKDLTRFRGNAFRQRGLVSVALRAIPYRIPTMEELDPENETATSPKGHTLRQESVCGAQMTAEIS